MDDLEDHFNPGKDLVVALVQLPPRLLRQKRGLIALHFSMHGALTPYIADPDQLKSEMIYVSGEPVMIYFLPGVGPGALQMVHDNPFEKGDAPKSPEPAETPKPDPFRIKE